jgi:Alpha/beta hydrolase domain
LLVPVRPADLEGPIPITETSHPFNGAAWSKVPVPLAEHGFVQEEFYALGEANVYEWVPGSDYELSVLRSAPYTTRVLVTRPEHPKDFSGRAVVDMINMSAGYDWQAVWSALWERVLAAGDAFVGITSKPNVFPSMARFDEKRYWRLSMANPLPSDAQACGRVPGEDGYDPNLSRLYENGLIWDVVSQVGALLKVEGGANPLGRPARRLYLAGESQSGDYLLRYFRWFHPRAITPAGAPIYDGYLCEDGIGSIYAIPPLHQCGERTLPLPADDPQRRIPGRGVPLFMLHSEWGFAAQRPRDLSPLYHHVLQEPSPRKADSNTAEDKFAMWELAGACHGWTWQYDFGDAALADLERAGMAETRAEFTCGPLQPEIQFYMVEKAAFEWLDRWVVEGTPPPSADPIETESGDVVRDELGNARGGLRLPEMDVPVATYAGLYAPGPDALDAIRPFDSSLLRRRYPSHEDYVHKYAAATAELCRRGYLLADDAETLMSRAAGRPVP